jgi:hypothetical protein
MAKIVLGIGTSHSPVLAMDAEHWKVRAEVDYKNPRLNMSDGRWVTYPELVAERGEPFAETATLENFLGMEANCQRALDRLADELAAAVPDVVVIVGDDQNELFQPSNQPALAIFHGKDVAMLNHEVMQRRYGQATGGEWRDQLARNYAMDENRIFPGHPELAASLIERLVDHDIDVGACAAVGDPSKSGFGHAYGFVIQRLFRGRRIPVVPIMVNTYYPPNVPTARRCHDVGRALRQAIEAFPEDLRVAVVASGGLSHFVVDEDLDKRVIAGFSPGQADLLRSLPRGALHSGSSEILCWILAAGAMEGLQPRWHEYQAIHRTPAGTGVGTAFAVWS